MIEVQDDLEVIKEAIKEEIDSRELAKPLDVGNGPYEHFGGSRNDVDMRLCVESGEVIVEIRNQDDFLRDEIEYVPMVYKRGHGIQEEAVVFQAELKSYTMLVKENKLMAIYEW